MTLAVHRTAIVRITYLAGLLGTTVMILAMLITGLGYRGVMNEPYSVLNHFVSELGEIGVSAFAPIFNLGLIFSGTCLITFVLGTAYFMGNWFGALYAIVGVIMGICGVLVGFFPINNLVAHVRVALPFFNLGFVSMLMFSAYVLLFRKRDLPLWLIVPAALATAAFFVLLFLTEPLHLSGDLVWSTQPYVLNRPAYSQLALMEWVVMLCILAWVAVVSLYLRAWHRQSRKIR